MAEKKKTPQPNGQQSEHFESDTDRIIHRHLENKDDVISEEDIRNVRIGVTPSHDEVKDERKNFEEEVENAQKTENGKAEDQTGNPITPWDTLQQ